MKSTETGMNILKGLLDPKKVDIDVAAEAAVEAALDEFDDFGESDMVEKRFSAWLFLPDNPDLAAAVTIGIIKLLNDNGVELKEGQYSVYDNKSGKIYDGSVWQRRVTKNEKD